MNVNQWNERHPKGTAVIWTRPDAEMAPVETVTTSPAWYLSGSSDQPVVNIADYHQPVHLHRVEPVVEGPTEQWEVRVARLCAELETAIGTQAPRMTVECVAHTLATHPTLEVSNATMDRVILLMMVTFSQGQEIERQRLGVVLDEQAVKLQ